jgi:glycosyltransferase involved in cell wall biosynthesis
MDSLITVITATYNRAHKLVKLYESLLNQRDQFFIWLIIDDGSEDKTNPLVSEWIQENKIEIKYIQQPNKGKHKAINRGVMEIDTTLTITVDSDDILTSDAIETIRRDWQNNKNKNIVGMMYLKSHFNDELIGDQFTIDYEVTTYENARWKERIRGDKAEVWLTKELLKHPYPEIDGENFFSEQYAYLAISGKGRLLAINKTIYKCEYLPNGLSSRIRELQYRNPQGAVINAIAISKSNYGSMRRFKSFIQIVTFSLISGKNMLSNLYSANYSFLWFPLFPIAIMYYFSLRIKYFVKSNIRVG